MFKIKNIFISSALVLNTLVAQAMGVGNHELIDENIATQHGYNLQGLQWVSGNETIGLDVRWDSNFVDTRYATAAEVSALLAGADLSVIDQVIGNGREVIELQYGGSDLKLNGESKCTLDGSISFWGSLCTLHENQGFSFDHIDSWVPSYQYTAQLLIVNPDYVKPREAWEWDEYSEVSPDDGAQLDLSGLTWMRFKTIAHMSSKEIKEALAWGGSLSDWRWATAAEVGALLKSDHDNEFQNVFGGSRMTLPHTLFYAGLEVNAAECNPLAEDIERQSLDTGCTIDLHMGDVSGQYSTLHNTINFRHFLFLGNQEQYAPALVRK
ncbi:hypothetical protein [Thalassomonas sp. RHCl1]|uniref:hypothetical protein n=1 Tax=Thalassomonas sp. RHCl1 TaxID=2995320 RepID=UPI00248B0A38|nr:hypothetical protein [Thalassomonas sp. RHCl1]